MNFMKKKCIVPIISVVLVIIAVASAFVAVMVTKNKEIRLSESDVSLSDIIVDGNKLSITITSADSLGMLITGNTYSYEDGKLKFKLFGKKSLKIGEPLKENQVLTLVINAPDKIKEVYFMYLNDKGEEKESIKAFTEGKI